tara:strand:+ start:5253 stop:9005 length:3753 start_codon:yes stop_codon:yes gene_type:complete
MSINKRLFGRPIDGEVFAKLQARQVNIPPKQLKEGSISYNNRTPFVRMWTSLGFIGVDKFVDDTTIVSPEEYDNIPDEYESSSDSTTPMTNEVQAKKNIAIIEDDNKTITQKILNVQTGFKLASLRPTADLYGDTNIGTAGENPQVQQGLEGLIEGNEGLNPLESIQLQQQTSALIDNTRQEKINNVLDYFIVPDKIYALNPNFKNKVNTNLITIERKYEASRVYVIGDDNYNSKISTDGDTVGALSNETVDETYKNIFPTVQSKNPYLKPSAGITSITSTTEGAVGHIKVTTVNFVVHNFYDFDNIYNKFFLKPGAQIFVDFGWSDIKELYNPEELINHKPGVVDYLYANPTEKNGRKGEITKNQGDLETIFGMVQDYDAKIEKNGSVNCSVTIRSTNSTLLDSSLDNKSKFKILESLESGFYYYCLKKMSKFTKDDDDEKSFEAGYIPNQNFEESDSKKLKTYYKTEFARIFEEINDINILTQFGVYALGSDLKDIYITWGMFEDYVINGHFGFGQNHKDVLDGNNFQVKMDSSTEYTTWSFVHNLTFSANAKSGKAPVVIYPEKWGKYEHGGETYESYSYLNKRYPNIDIDTEVNHYEDKHKKGFNKRFTKIPLREVFINLNEVYKVFNTSKDANIHTIVMRLLKTINSGTNSLFDWDIAEGQTSSQLKIIDKNYGLNQEIAQDNINFFVFDVMSPTSQVVDYNFSFKIPSGRLGDYYAISGMSHENSIFSVDDGVREASRVFGIDFDNTSLNYLPDLQGNSAEAHLDDNNSSSNESVYDTINDLLSDEILTLGDDSIKLASNIKIDTTENPIYTSTSEDGNGSDGNSDEASGPPINYLNENNKAMKRHGIKVASSYAQYYAFIEGRELNDKGVGLLPFTLELKIPGIATIVPGDTFRVNYLPKDYKIKTYCQTMKVSHDVTSAGWYTTLETQFRELFPSLKNLVFKDFSTENVCLSADALFTAPYNLNTMDGPILYNIDAGSYGSMQKSVAKLIISEVRQDLTYSGYFDYVFEIKLKNISKVISSGTPLFDETFCHNVEGGNPKGVKTFSANVGSATFIPFDDNEELFKKAIEEVKKIKVGSSNLTVNEYDSMYPVVGTNITEPFNDFAKTGDFLVPSTTIKTYKGYKQAHSKFMTLGNATMVSNGKYKLVVKNGHYAFIGPYKSDNSQDDVPMGMPKTSTDFFNSNVFMSKARVDAIIGFYDNYFMNSDNYATTSIGGIKVGRFEIQSGYTQKREFFGGRSKNVD